MGGEYRNEEYFDITKEELIKNWPGYVEQWAYDCGHGGYTGTFAEKPDPLEFIPRDPDNPRKLWDRDAAEEHCANNNDKWGPAWAYCIGPQKWYIGGWCSS